MFESQVSKSIEISLALDKSGKEEGGTHSKVRGKSGIVTAGTLYWRFLEVRGAILCAFA